ncbi:MMPL family transporter [Rhodopirellula sp. MGV]|uniref:MMPL family transporter n=1 Tax=Rhodopirellula sp. MGV TaxID=2023130 RepID=UPI000B97917D|nr:MMPL family transporter [Rhodopirellula sp. MGV]OYP36527.1 transporter [Rhodopirellula sp. MGV]
MLSILTERLAKTTTSRPWVTMLGWVLITAAFVFFAPRWTDIAYDGDFEYLPDQMNTVAAAKVLDEAFPGERARSEVVLVLGRDKTQEGGHVALSDLDLMVGDDLLRRLHHRLAEVCWQRAIRLGYESGPIDEAPDECRPWLERAQVALDHSVTVDARFYEAYQQFVPDTAPSLTEPRMAISYYDRWQLAMLIGADPDKADGDLEDARLLMPDIESEVIPIADRELGSWDAMLDLLSWDDTILGSLLSKPAARLAVIRMSSELAATGNIAMLEGLDSLLNEVRQYSMGHANEAQADRTPLRLEYTGSAAIGGETLIAARDAIRYTESITVIMILLILIVVYRAPLLVAVPMVSIGVAVAVATCLVALLTDWSIRDVVSWLDMRVFTTSRIFIVVILFGAGTDYCLFLIARLREEAAKAEWREACRNALSGVTSALLGSALTTVFGLAMLWFADFGKYHYTGPIIAICLLVGLLVCLTLTPALLSALGPSVFWPGVVRPDPNPSRSLFATGPDGHAIRRKSIWDWIAIKITRRPRTTFVVGISLLLLPAIYGWRSEQSVTYDLSSQLDNDAASRRGFQLLSQHFEIGKINPVTVLIVRPEGEAREQLRKDIGTLSDQLYEQPGVVGVRTANDPLGDFPPNREMGLLSGEAWKRRALRQHRVAQNYFFSNNPDYQDRLARLDVIIDGDPFSIETAKLVSGIGKLLGDVSENPDSVWHDAKFYYTGTTPSIIDLRSVTIADNARIKLAVVIAVLVILIAVIRRVGLCLYLIFTVLLSYYATLGMTVLFFRAAYGDAYVGLDWKLPLFLFVILVAVGQDYNVYLVTRIVEEQKTRPWLSALRYAVSRTGGIITACGMVMAATFFSMTASAWLPAVLNLVGIQTDATSGLKGVIELGFALGLGVLIDTFYVRTVLVPSFVVLTGKSKKVSGTFSGR